MMFFEAVVSPRQAAAGPLARVLSHGGRAGMNGHAPKPINAADFLAKVACWSTPNRARAAQGSPRGTPSAR
jgi:hypothetical protein